VVEPMHHQNKVGGLSPWSTAITGLERKNEEIGLTLVGLRLDLGVQLSHI
jgi:hypothetical protein